VTVTTSGVTGATNYVYEIVGVNAAGNILPPPYGVGYTNSGNVTLSGSNFNVVSWPSISGAVSYNVYRSVGTAAQGLITNTASTTYNDTGAAASGSIPSSATATIGTSGFTQVVVQNHYALIPVGTGSTAFQIFNVLDPSKPTLINSVSGNASNYLTVQNNYVYTVSSSGMQIFDITNIFSPTLVSTTSLQNGTGVSETPGTILVSGRYAYVTTSGGNHLEIFDISNPSSPILVSVTSVGPGGGSFMAISGKYLYVAVNFNAMPVKVFDISNPASPVLATTFVAAFNAAPSGFYIQGHYLYLVPALSVPLIQVVDISNPTNLVTAGIYAPSWPSNGIGTIFVQGRYAYVTVFNGNPGGYNALQTYDVSNPSQITLLSAQPLTHGGGTHGLFVSGRYAYVASNQVLQTFDLGGEYAQN
jgi:hypothetical protein